MRIRPFFLQLFLIYGLVHTILGPEVFSQSIIIEDMVPQKGEAGVWIPDGSVQYAAGDDLYLLINGGAEIYHEYGFKKAAFQSYLSTSGQSINLEIYEMVSSDAAYGIYTFKTGQSGTEIDIGNESWLESYYLNMWKGPFLITIVGMGAEKEIVDGLIKLAEVVDGKFDEHSQRPKLTTYLPSDNLKTNGIIYLRGNLALFNQYRFDTKNIFGLKEGVIGNYDGYSVFIFQYNNQAEALNWYQKAKVHILNSNKYNNFTEHDDGFEVNENTKNRIVIKTFRNWIVTIIGESIPDISSIFLSVKNKLSN